ncbi:hypothetical protein NDU88_003046 [Pleurodeles waltl]|uniref:Uncharacterized protein n=1 Tax=Pleurodeles waltl TaxID=8319 RepID=A0AAV7T4Z6_PLEWA|nr:hypothetical protein NDU88_003046 [Pleurodeles waltl]
MGKGRRPAPLQGNTMELYTTHALSGQREMCLTRRGTGVGLVTPVTKPTRAELLVAIQGSREALEWKIESVAVKCSLLQAGLRKVSDRVHITEGSISEIRMEVDTLRRQMAEVTSRAGTLEDRVNDTEGRSHSNNIRLIGFPERAEESSVEAFVEHWV